MEKTGAPEDALRMATIKQMPESICVR